MKDLDAERRWQRLIGLLEPIHETSFGNGAQPVSLPG